jgi:hypothetical protein
MPGPDETTTVLPVADAAVRLGVSVDAIRSRVRRGHLETRRGNDGRTLILVPNSMLENANDGLSLGDGEATDELATELRRERDRLLTERDQARTDCEAWRVKAEEARLVGARAEAERDGLRLVVARLEADLDWARRPWWRRWFDQGAGR